MWFLDRQTLLPFRRQNRSGLRFQPMHLFLTDSTCLKHDFSRRVPSVAVYPWSISVRNELKTRCPLCVQTEGTESKQLKWLQSNFSMLSSSWERRRKRIVLLQHPQSIEMLAEVGLISSGKNKTAIGYPLDKPKYIMRGFTHLKKYYISSLFESCSSQGYLPVMSEV